MKAVRSFIILTITILGSSIFSSAQGYAPAGSRVRSTDEQVYRKLKGLVHYGVFDNITWQVNGSTVTLSGKVISLGAKREAAAAVKDIPGVTSVVNNIEELPPSPSDDRIRRAAVIQFVNHGPAQYFGEPNPAVRVIVENSTITLEGYVARKSDSDLLNILANGISGVFNVTNNLVIGERKF
jgi:osmotically-inducible protein OsmY